MVLLKLITVFEPRGINNWGGIELTPRFVCMATWRERKLKKKKDFLTIIRVEVINFERVEHNIMMMDEAKDDED